MTNGFGRPTAARIAPRRNPSVAPAPDTTDRAQASTTATLDPSTEGPALPESEPTLLDDAQDEQPAAQDTAEVHVPDPVQSEDTADKPGADAVDDSQQADDAPGETTESPQPSIQNDADSTDTGADNPASGASKARKPRKPRTSGKPAEPAPTAGASLVVIGVDGEIEVDDSVHVVDLRNVATETDPHTLVDQLSALSNVSDSKVRSTAAAAITEAITKAALAT